MSSERDTASVRTAMSWRFAFVYVIGAIFLLTLALFIVMLIGHTMGWMIDREVKLVNTTGIAVIYLAMILGAAVVMHVRGMTGLMVLLMALALTAFVLWRQLIWNRPDDWNTYGWMTFAGFQATLFALTLLHTGGFACLKPRTAALNGLRVLAIVAMLCFALSLAGTVMIDFLDFIPWIGMMYILPMLGIVTLISSLVTPLLIQNDRRRWEAARESVAGRVMLSLDCPKCGERQQMATGAGRCKDCNAIIAIELEEPRCDCGYLLYQLTSPTCPECGREIPEDRRWPREIEN